MNVGLRVSPRDRRTLIMGALTIGTTLLASRGVPAWRAWDQHARSASTDAMNELAAIEQQLRLLPALRDSARSRSLRADALRSRLIGAPSVTSAGAALASQVTDIADDLGLKVNAIQIRPDSVFRDKHARVGVRLTAIGDVTHLADLLSALESTAASLAIRELSISPGDPMLPDGRPETLRFQIMVEGLAVRDSSGKRQ
ncbi:MAG: type II secretion system protein GspM [bacterium]